MTNHAKHSSSAVGSSSRSSHATGEVLVIGIDFGTTCSGVSYATTAMYKRRKVTCIRKWLDSGRDECKVPTELYLRDGRRALWGYGIPKDEARLQLFKLLLPDYEDLSPEMQASPLLAQARADLENANMTAVNAVTQYLQLLWNHVKDILRKDLGERFLNGLPFHIVVTVPAIWKPSARLRMEEAVKATDILKSRRGVSSTFLELVSEPEAATIATLWRRQDLTYPNDKFVVCDAGGGTVDLITYSIDGVGPIRMSEAVGGTGGLCGGVFVDQDFQDMCQQRLGPRWYELNMAAYNEIIRLKWEYDIKRPFQVKTGSEWRYYPLSLVTEHTIDLYDFEDKTADPHIVKGKIMFQTSHIEQAFARCLDRIWRLVQDQIEGAYAANAERPVTGVILVGGLGTSPHLYNFLQDKLAPWNIEVIKPPGEDARSAIAYGAVCKGFDNASRAYHVAKPVRVTSTISRISVGMKCRPTWDETIHDEQDKVWVEEEGVWRADNQMQWYLWKGDRVDTREPVWHHFFHLHPENWDGRWEQPMLQCENETPPSRFTSTVSPLCSLSCALEPRIKVSSLQNHITPHQTTMKRVDFSVGMVPSGGSVNFEVWVSGIRLGEKNLAIHELTWGGDDDGDFSADFENLAL